MAQIGEKRPAEEQIGPEDTEDETTTIAEKPASLKTQAGLVKRSPLSSSSSSSTSPTAAQPLSGGGGIVFRPSLLQTAAQGFTFKQSSLNPIVASKFGSPVAAAATSSSSPQPTDLQQSAATTTSPKSGGKFLKLNSDDIKTITITTPTIMLSDNSKATDQIAGGVSGQNHNHAQRDNPFLQFLSSTRSSSQTFSSLVSSGAPASPGFTTTATPTGEQLSSEGNGEATSSTDAGYEKAEANQTPPAAASESSGLAKLESTSPQCDTFGSQPVTAILPKVQRVTGEEREKNIVQVPARLYAFDVAHHSWKERGRGEVRLNDACQSEGVFQSRLVMRTLGSYHVLLNTHLWAQMKCERANQKSIRITAQHGNHGNVSVFLIMGAAKDIQQLYTAIDRRMEALRRNASESDREEEGAPDIITTESQMASFDEDDFLDGPHSSPESSPEPHSSTRLRLVQQKFGTETSDDLQDDEPEVSLAVKEDGSKRQGSSSECLPSTSDTNSEQSNDL